MKTLKLVNTHTLKLYKKFKYFNDWQYITSTFKPQNDEIIDAYSNNKYQYLNSVLEHYTTMYQLNFLNLDADYIVFTGCRDEFTITNTRDLHVISIPFPKTLKFKVDNQYDNECKGNIINQFKMCHCQNLTHLCALQLFIYTLNDSNFENYLNNNNELFRGAYFACPINMYKQEIFPYIEKFILAYLEFNNTYQSLITTKFKDISNTRFYALLMERWMSYALFNISKKVNIVRLHDKTLMSESSTTIK